MHIFVQKCGDNCRYMWWNTLSINMRATHLVAFLLNHGPAPFRPIYLLSFDWRKHRFWANQIENNWEYPSFFSQFFFISTNSWNNTTSLEIDDWRQYRMNLNGICSASEQMSGSSLTLKLGFPWLASVLYLIYIHIFVFNHHCLPWQLMLTSVGVYFKVKIISNLKMFCQFDV